jgi:putative ABC transport system permease protein
MSYALATLWYERQRYLPGVLAVAFSALLIALQCGLLLGLFSITSIPVDRTRAHIWVGSPEVLSVDLGRPVSERFLARLASEPGVLPPEIFLQGFAYWTNPKGGSELCIVMGSRLGDEDLGWVNGLTPELREKLTEPDSVVVDETELGRLGITGVGDTAEITGRRVRIVGLIKGYKSLAGPYIFCSLRTAKPMLHLRQDQTMYMLARCENPADAPKVAERMRQEYADMSTYTAEDFSLRSRLHWLTKTKGGIALSYAAMLGLLVGGVVTSQTLYAATVASLREYAVLRALGIPRWRMAMTVLAQSFWVGMAGIVLGLPASFGLAAGAEALGAKVLLPWWLLAGATVVTMTMAMISGLAALRSLRLIEPAVLLR